MLKNLSVSTALLAVILSGCCNNQSAAPVAPQGADIAAFNAELAASYDNYPSLFCIQSGITSSDVDNGFLMNSHTVTVSKPLAYNSGDIAVAIQVSESKFRWNGEIDVCTVEMLKDGTVVESFSVGKPDDNLKSHTYNVQFTPNAELKADQLRLKLLNPTDGDIFISNLELKNLK